MNTGHGNIAVYIIEGLMVFLILWKIFSARGGKSLFIRRIPGLSVLDEAIGRSAEMGKPMLFSPGIGGFGIVSLQALSIMSHVIKHAAKYSTRVIVPTADALVYTIAEEVAKDTYSTSGAPEQFIPEDIRYLSDSQFAWASGVVGIQHREKVATAFYFGQYYAEAIIIAENGQMNGAIQIAGTPMTTQIPFFLATCDYTIIGDEYYAASAYISREPTLLGSLVGQDWCKILLIIVFIIGTIIATLNAFHINPAPIKWFINHFLRLFPGGKL